MRKIIAFVILHLAVLGPLAAETDVAHESELKDLMPVIDEATRNLDSNVAQKNVEAAGTDAKALEEALTKVEAYFVRRGDAADAVAFARKTRGLVVEVSRSARSGDFDAASGSVGTLVRSCKACHDAYRME
jgi:cytochrome c556